MASIQGIYLALFGRPADPAGLAYWNEQSKNGADLSKIIEVMTKAPEAVARFSGLSDAALVTGIYQALFDRAPDAAGLAFFTEQLKSGKQAIGSLAINILDGAGGNDLILVQNREKAANAFTASLDTPAEIAAYSGTAAADFGRSFIKTVTTDPASIPTADKIQASINTSLPGASSGQAPVGGNAPAAGGSTGGESTDPGTTNPQPTPETFTVTKAVANLANTFQGGVLFAGDGNPSNGMNIATATGSQNHKIELALDARYDKKAVDVAPATTKDGVAIFSVNEGADVRFAYSAGISPNTGNEKLNLDLFDYKLRIDTDKTINTSFFDLSLGRGDGTGSNNRSDSPYVWTNGAVKIVDDGGNSSVTQNIQAIAWGSDGKAVAVNAGDQYDIKLEAYLKGSTTKIAETAIKLVGNPAPTPSADLSTAASYNGTKTLWAGSGNSSEKFAVTTFTQDGIELGLSGRMKGASPVEGKLGSDGLVHFKLAEGNNARFAYSVASKDADPLSNNLFKLKIDVDSSDATKFVELILNNRTEAIKAENPTKNHTNTTNSKYIWSNEKGTINIVDDGGDGGADGKTGNGNVTQNIENISWFDSTPKVDALAAGKYDVILEAWSADGVTLIGTNHVVFDIAAVA